MSLFLLLNIVAVVFPGESKYVAQGSRNSGLGDCEAIVLRTRWGWGIWIMHSELGIAQVVQNLMRGHRSALCTALAALHVAWHQEEQI